MDSAARPSGPIAEAAVAVAGLNDRDLALRFESLGGAGHGCEFGLFQRHCGAEPLGLLRWADLGADLLVRALEDRFDGVGMAENTIIFVPDGNDEWWTRDSRYWMAMRSFVKTADADLDRMGVQVRRRLGFLRRKLIEDLEAGEKMFVFKDMSRDLSDLEIGRLLAAVRSYGDATLFYIRYADAAHPAGTVEAGAPGLLIGYIGSFTFSRTNDYIGPSHGALLTLCRRAWEIRSAAALPVAAVTVPGPGRLAVGRPRRIVLFGNCQMQAMMQLYQRFVAGRTGDVLEHIPSYTDLTEQSRASISGADVVVEQLLDLKPQADADGISTTGSRLYIPMTTAAFLWPFAGQPHPKNRDYPFLTGGPYGGEASDSYLNRLILADTDPEEAVETYANLDVRKRVNLDRLFELVMDRQRSRDAATGYQIADVIERHFRTEQIFLSPYHPNRRIAVALATQFFEQMGVEQDDIERMQQRTVSTPFPLGELPLHPAVCAHFGMDFVPPDRRYRFMNEGSFTFREYALRYMRYEWNGALEEGMSLAHARDYVPAVERLRTGLESSPESAAGYNALGHVLNHIGAAEEAVAASRQAVAIEPANASYRSNLGSLLRGQGLPAQAESELRAAVAAEPTHPHYYVLLAHLLRQTAKANEAGELLRQAIALDPWSAILRVDLADVLDSQGDHAGGLAALQDALALDADNADLHLRIARAVGRLDRTGDAAAVQRAVDLAPESVPARIALSECLLREGRHQDALTQAYIAAVTDPDNARAYAHLGHTLRLTNDFAAAEHAFRRAIGLQPGAAHMRHELSSLLSHLERYPEAAAAAREAAELDPGNPDRLAHLAHILARGQNYPEAQAVQRQAIAMAPGMVNLRLVLSDLFAREGRMAEALAEARTAVAMAPGEAHPLGHLAHIRQMMGDLGEAEAGLRRALELAPHNDHLRRQYTLLLGRMPERSAA